MIFVKVYAVIEQLEEHQVPLLLHGGSNFHNHVDIFDREKRFLDEGIITSIETVRNLKLCLSTSPTSDAAHFVLEQDRNVAATILHNIYYLTVMICWLVVINRTSTVYQF